MPSKLSQFLKGLKEGSTQTGRESGEDNPPPGDAKKEGGTDVGNVADQLKAAMAIDGALGVALVDFNSGMTLGTEGGGPNLDLEVAAAGNTEVVRAKMKTLSRLGINDKIEDILITLGSQFVLLRLIAGASGEGLFVYLALDRTKANLAMARRELQNIERNLII
jgi:hypothetical protein